MNNIKYRIMDTMTMVTRSMKHTTRHAEILIITMIMPLMQLLMLVYVLGGAMNVGEFKYLDYVLPGILLMAIGSSVTMTAVSVKEDMSKGIMDRFLTMNIGRSAVLNGHLSATFLRTAITATMIIVVSVLLGFRVSMSLQDVIVSFGLIFMFTLMYTWLSIAWGLLCPSLEAVGSLTYLGMLLPYMSSCFVPVNTMPSFIQSFAQYQPFTPLGDSLRGLFLGLDTGNAPLIAFTWCTSLFILFYSLSMFVYHKKAR